MKRIFIIGHWVLTLLLAPVISQAIEYIWGANPHQVVGLLEVYPIALVFSIAFSLPTFLVYLLCFRFLARRDINFAVAKTILIAVSIIGIYTTQTIIGGTMSQDIIIAYSVTTVIVGLLLRLRTSKTQDDNSIIT